MLAQLLSSLEAVEADLSDLEEVLGVVEANRARFPHLDDEEVASRRNFVRSSRRVTLSIRDDVSTHAPKSGRVSGGKVRGEEREGLLAESSGTPSARSTGSPGGTPASAGSSGFGGGGGAAAAAARDRELAAVRDANADTMESGLSMQEAQLAEQEDVLEDLGSAVRRIRSMGQEMNDELSTQSRMLNELESSVDSASEAMRGLKDKMKQMANSKDRGKFCAIIVLTLALWGLTCLVLYTR